jgi:hypothetical protein
MRERREQADVPVGGLGEVRLAEGAALDHVEHEGVDLGPYRLHEVESERLATLGIRVDDPETGVEPDRLAGEDRLCLDERVEVVQHRVHRSFGFTVRGSRREHRAAPFVA